jgi:two-component system CheB/CheR fusion protein
MAFVLISHLTRSTKVCSPRSSPKRPPWSSRRRRAPVAQSRLRDPAQHEPDHPHGILRLAPRSQAVGQYLPIDGFLSSLAEDRGSQAIGVILSGTGSDGAQGIQAIRAAGGLTFAEDEGSAGYADMPHSAAATGSVDFILPPADIARRLAHSSGTPTSAARRPARTAAAGDGPATRPVTGPATGRRRAGRRPTAPSTCSRC